MQQFSHLSFAAALMGLVSAGGCHVEEAGVSPARPSMPARRAAMSFVHCVETGGGGCVRNSDKQRAWDAFAFLGWLANGSPTSILQALPRELAHHRDPRLVAKRFVEQARRLREPVRGSECSDQDARPVSELIPKVRVHVEQRMTGFGLWGAQMLSIVDRLEATASAGLGDAYLVHMHCQADPHDLWVAATTEGDRYTVVGVMTGLPDYLGGDAPGREAVETRIQSTSLGSVVGEGPVREGRVDSRWIPVPVEEF